MLLLARINAHPRDANIIFEEMVDGVNVHRYTLTIGDKVVNPKSVTTLIHDYFPKFDADKIIDNMMRGRNWTSSKYYGMTKDEIKDKWTKDGREASGLGTIMHNDIEYFFNQEPVLYPDTIEHSYFQSFWSEFQKMYPQFQIYRTEWLVYDEDVNVSGSIDCVLSDQNGNLILLDWKRSKDIKKVNKYQKAFPPFDNLDDCNYSQYSLQLNFYRHMLERKYNKNVIYMMLVIFHPNNPTYICEPVSHIDLNDIWPSINK